MGLYLTVFEGDDEIEGLEVGSYEDFEFFRETVTSVVEGGVAGSVCPTLILHSDCDGVWEQDEAQVLLQELDVIEREFRSAAPVDFNSDWKHEVAQTFGIKPSNLLECFFDVDGESLVARLRQLAAAAVARGVPILFQ
jgi:hypothetical protein